MIEGRMALEEISVELLRAQFPVVRESASWHIHFAIECGRDDRRRTAFARHLRDEINTVSSDVGPNTRPIAEKPPHPQAADMAVRPGDPVIIVVAPSCEVDGRRTYSNRGAVIRQFG